MIDRLSQSIQLQDGRTLGYAVYGPSDGSPVFYFTGGNSSRLEGHWFSEAVWRCNVRLIVPDRPGFGLSDFQSGRRLLDWPDDVIALADALAINSFGVFGLSGGAPHVLAAAHKISDRLTRIAVISGVAPPEAADRFAGMWPPVRLIYESANRLPTFNRFLLKQMAGFYSDRDQMLKRMKQAMPAPDVALIEARPEIIDIFAESTREAHRNGVQGDAWEWQLYVNPWGFDMAGIDREVALWYGRYDQQAPPAMGRYYAAALPNGRLIEVEDGGHFSTINNHIDEILAYVGG